MSYSFSQVVITYLINILGNDSLATRTYTVNTTMFVYLFAIAMAQGGAISIGHLVGQKKIRAAYLLGKYVMRLSILVSWGFRASGPSSAIPFSACLPITRTSFAWV